MKKKIAYFLISLFIILIASYLLRYKTSNNISHCIPKNAVAAISIDTRQIEHHFLIDFMFNPYEYIKNFKTKNKDSIQYFSLYQDINLPKNIVFFTKDSLLKTWVSSKIELNSLKNITNLLTSNNFILIHINKLNVYRKNKIYVIIQNSNMYLCTTNDNINDVINSYFKKTDYISEETEMYKQLNNSTSDISFASLKNNTIDISFKNGKIEILGNLYFNFLEEISTINNDSSIAKLSVSFNKNSKTFKNLIDYINPEKFRKLTKINLDTLVEKWTGKLHFTLNNFKTKIDTIITYTYDDNFNKVENISTKKNIKPNFIITFGMYGNINSFLENSGALIVSEKDSIYAPLPIVKTYISSSSNNLSFFTNNKKLKFSKKNNKLSGYINANTYRKQSDSTIFDFLNEYKLIKNVNIKINNTNNIKANIGINTKNNAFVFLTKEFF